MDLAIVVLNDDMMYQVKTLLKNIYLGRDSNEQVEEVTTTVYVDGVEINIHIYPFLITESQVESGEIYFRDEHGIIYASELSSDAALYPLQLMENILSTLAQHDRPRLLLGLHDESGRRVVSLDDCLSFALKNEILYDESFGALKELDLQRAIDTVIEKMNPDASTIETTYDDGTYESTDQTSSSYQYPFNEEYSA